MDEKDKREVDMDGVSVGVEALLDDTVAAAVAELDAPAVTEPVGVSVCVASLLGEMVTAAVGEPDAPEVTEPVGVSD